MRCYDQTKTGRQYQAFLFDMDGTLINSIPMVERIWRSWAEKQKLNAAGLLTKIHGIRAVDAIAALHLPGIDPAEEAANLLGEELSSTAGIFPIPGVLQFLSQLPLERWAIVTSAPRALAEFRLAAMGIASPRVMVCAEDVSSGKPDPACYELGAALLGFSPQDCLVFEDAPAGILAGERAGADIVVITTTHAHLLETDHLAVASFNDLVAAVTGQGLLEVRTAPKETP